MPSSRRPALQPWSGVGAALRLLLGGATVRTCLPVAVVVGTVLSLVNQGDVIAAGDAGPLVAAKVVANYVIPFLTSSTGALLAVRRHGTGLRGPRRDWDGLSG